MEDEKTNKTLYESTLSSQQSRLLNAVRKGSLTNVEKFLKKLSEAKKQEKSFDYVLITTALKNKHKLIAKLLLKSNCRVTTDVKTKFLCSPLYYAIELDDAKIISDLLKRGASVFDKDVNDKTALELAIQRKKFELVDQILNNRQPIQPYEDSDLERQNDLLLFHTACYMCDTNAITEFLKCGFSTNSRSAFERNKWSGFTPLHFVLSSPKSWLRQESAEILFSDGADISAQDHRGSTPVHIAFKNGEKEYSSSSLHPKFFKKWIDDLTMKKFSNLQDQNGLSYFHIVCYGSDDTGVILDYVNAAQCFLNNGVDINSAVSLDDPEYPGYTALHFAVKNFCHDMVQLLLSKGANVTRANGEGLTPLHMACDYIAVPTETAFTKKPSVKREDRLKTVLLLLEHGADVDAEDSEGSTPLHYAFYYEERNEPLTQFLLPKSQLSSNLTDHHGISYLHIASTVDLSAVETLMKNGCSAQSSVSLDCDHFGSGYSALHFAVSFNKLDIVQYLLEHGVDPNVEVDGQSSTTALHIASSCEIPNFDNIIRQNDPVTDIQTYITNRSHIITTLLKYGASVNYTDASGNTPLLIASLIPMYFENVENEESIQDQLEKFERSTDSSDSDPSESSRPETVKEKFPPLLKSKILERLNDNQISTIKILLHHGADIHSRNDRGETVLHNITGQGELQQKKSLAEMMLKKGADVNAANPSGLAPLHYIMMSCLRHPSELPLFELFCEYDVDMNAQSSRLGTPLHMIARSDEDQDEESVEEAQKLLELILCHPTVDLDIRNQSGDTPLHVAARVRDEDYPTSTSSSRDSDSPLELTNEKCVIELLSAGADVFIKNFAGLTPFDLLYNRLTDVFATAWDRFFIRDHSYLLISVITHLKKMMKINFPMSDLIEDKFDELLALCPKILSTIDAVLDKEIKMLKTTMIDQFTSLYEILLKDSNEMAKHVKNDKFKMILESPTSDSEFRIYRGMLIRQFQRGFARLEVLEPAKEALSFITQISWPALCAENVAKYLSNKDLKNLTGSVSIEKSFNPFHKGTSMFKGLLPKIQKTSSAYTWLEPIDFCLVLKLNA